MVRMRIRWCVGVLGAAFGFWAFYWYGLDGRFVPPLQESQQVGRSAIRAWSNKVTVTYDRHPLNEVLFDLEGAAGVPIKFDDQAIDAVGFDPLTPITIDLRDVSLRSSLKLILHPLGLSFASTDDGIRVTTSKDAADSKWFVGRHHPIAPPSAWSSAEGTRRLADLVATRLSNPDRVQILPGGLFVYDHWEVHERIDSLIQQLEETTPPSQSLDPILLSDNPRETRKSNARVHAALSEPTSLYFDEATIDEVAQEIGRRHNVSIVFDRQTLADIGFIDKRIFTGDYEGVTLVNAINDLLDDAGEKSGTELRKWFKLHVADEAIRLRADVDENTRRRQMLHPIGDLVSAGGVVNSESIFDLFGYPITSGGWRNMWRNAVPFVLDNRWLAAYEDESDTTSITHALATLRTLDHSADEPASLLQEPATRKKIKQMLRQPVDWEFKNKSLEEVRQLLSERLKIKVVIEASELRRRIAFDAGVFSFPSSDQQPQPANSLAVELSRTLAEYDVGFYVPDDTIVITAYHLANTISECEVIPIRWLIDEDVGLVSKEQFPSLIRDLTVAGRMSFPEIFGHLLVSLGSSHEVEETLNCLKWLRANREQLPRISSQTPTNDTAARLLAGLKSDDPVCRRYSAFAIHAIDQPSRKFYQEILRERESIDEEQLPSIDARLAFWSVKYPDVTDEPRAKLIQAFFKNLDLIHETWYLEDDLLLSPSSNDRRVTWGMNPSLSNATRRRLLERLFNEMIAETIPVSEALVIHERIDPSRRWTKGVLLWWVEDERDDDLDQLSTLSPTDLAPIITKYRKDSHQDIRP